MRYLFNSAVLTSPGLYRYNNLSREEAWEWAPRGARQSAIDSEETAEALGDLLGLPVPIDRRTVAMAVNDEALVFRLVLPPGTPPIKPGDKSAIARAVHAGYFELGLLTRVA